MKLPDFIIVGTARAGTTALHYNLRRHPQVFLPSQKEPCFFCFAGEKPGYKNGKFLFTVREPAAYEKLFRKAGADAVKGEISTPYVYLYSKTIENIKKYYRDAELPKILIVLRNPVERAYSQYLWKVRDGQESMNFYEAILTEENRVKENYSIDFHYAGRGLYADAVKAFKEHFPAVKIILFEELRSDFHVVMREICNFIGVDDSFKFDESLNVNSSSLPLYSFAGRMVTAESKIKYALLRHLPDSLKIILKEKMARLNSSGNIPKMQDSAKKYLQEFYRQDIIKLKSLTGLDLNSWNE